MSNQQRHCDELQKYVISAGAREKRPTRASGKLDAETTSTWSFDMEGHAKKCSERCCDLANKTTEQFGDPPTAAPAPVSGPSPTIHLVNTDPFARARIDAVQSRVAAPVVSDPRPPPPVPAFSPFLDGHYWCSKCPRKGFTTIPGLMRHITHQHAGSTLDEAACSLFTAIERVTCTAPACGGLRRVGARVCNRCGQASQPRPPLVGDIIMGPLGAPVSGEDTTMVDADVNVTPSLTVDLPPVDLPGDFTQRIRALPSNTILHVPASCRLRMISAVAQCWNGMAQGLDDYPQLEEGRSKLLLSPGLECGHRGSETSHSWGGAALRDASATC